MAEKKIKCPVTTKKKVRVKSKKKVAPLSKMKWCLPANEKRQWIGLGHIWIIDKPTPLDDFEFDR